MLVVEDILYTDICPKRPPWVFRFMETIWWLELYPEPHVCMSYTHKLCAYDIWLI